MVNAPMDAVRLPNLVIGITFALATACMGWLYWHRRGDWPKSWAILIICNCLLSCGVSRICHAFHAGDLILAATNWWAAIGGILAVILLPWAVSVISRLPTPKEVEHAIRGNLVKREALAEADRMKKRKEKAEAVADLLHGLFAQLTIPDVVKVQVEAVISELRNDSDVPNG